MSSWNDPISKLYPEFEAWLKNRRKRVESYIEPAKTKVAYSWYKSGADIAIKDKADYNKKLFSTKTIQEAYKQYLKGDGVNGDPIIQKFQSGNIMGDEIAFYVRHAPISQALTCGYMQRNNTPFIEDMYRQRIKRLCSACQESKSKLNGN